MFAQKLLIETVHKHEIKGEIRNGTVILYIVSRFNFLKYWCVDETITLPPSIYQGKFQMKVIYLLHCNRNVNVFL